MARYYTYNANLKGQATIQVNCEHCQHTFSYPKPLKQIRSSENLGYRPPNPNVNAALAQKHQTIILEKYVRQVLHVLGQGDYGYAKCPQCHQYQAWMALAVKQNRAKWGAVIGAVVVLLLLLGSEIMVSPTALIEGLLMSLPLVLAAGLVTYRVMLRFSPPSFPKNTSPVPQVSFNPALRFSAVPQARVKQPLENLLPWWAFLLLVVLGTVIIFVATQAVGFERPILPFVMALIGGGLLAVAIDIVIVPALHSLEVASFTKQVLWTLASGGLIPLTLLAGLSADRLLVEAEIIETLVAAANPVCQAPHVQAHEPGGEIGSVWVHGATHDAAGMGLVRAEVVQDIQTLLCVKQREATIENCDYIGEDGESSVGTVTRIRYDWDIEVVDWTTGQTLGRKSFFGGDPAECPDELWVSQNENPGKVYYGNPPHLPEVGNWVKELR